MSKYWSRVVKSIVPYVPGEQPKDQKYIKLNTNENPYLPSPRVLEAITGAVRENLQLYPDPGCDDLRTIISGYYSLEKENVFIGNGSDEVLAFSFLAFFDPGKPVYFPDITYSFYPVYADLFRIDYQVVPVDDDFSIPLNKFPCRAGGIIFPNPNAPTGKCLPLDEIRFLLEQNKDTVVIVDEAYIDFGGDSAVDYIRKYPNLLVIQTFSKSRSLAGLRVGFALGDGQLIEGLERVKNSFNSYTLDRLALIGAAEAIKDQAYFKGTIDKIVQTRERTVGCLEGMGFHVIPSQANFIFIRHPRMNAATLFQRLRDKGILVRYFNKPRIDDFLRVTIGTDAEMNIFLAKTGEIMGNF